MKTADAVFVTLWVTVAVLLVFAAVYQRGVKDGEYRTCTNVLHDLMLAKFSVAASFVTEQPCHVLAEGK